MTPPSNAGGEGREVLARAQEAAWAWINRYLDGVVHPADHGELTAAFLAFSTRENADDRAPALVEAAVAEAGELLDMLRDECWDLRCFDIQTGGDDADVGWTVIGHWQAKPREREIAQGWSDDPRVALREARKTLRTTPSQEASNVG